MAQPIVNVALLDDHQSVLDGYYYRLEKDPRIRIVGAARHGAALEALLAEHPVDVVLLDLGVPTSATNPAPYPVLYALPNLRERYPNLALLVITMTAERALVQAVISAGASGYVLKDDQAAIAGLAGIVLGVTRDELYYSEAVKALFDQPSAAPEAAGLTRRQLQALALCAAHPGEPQASLAARMGIRESTLRNLMWGVYVRLNVRNRAEAIVKARALGLIAGEPVVPSLTGGEEA